MLDFQELSIKVLNDYRGPGFRNGFSAPCPPPFPPTLSASYLSFSVFKEPNHMTARKPGPL